MELSETTYELLSDEDFENLTNLEAMLLLEKRMAEINAFSLGLGVKVTL